MLGRSEDSCPAATLAAHRLPPAQARAALEQMQRRRQEAVTGRPADLLVDLADMRWLTVVLLNWRQECRRGGETQPMIEDGLHVLCSTISAP